jgi:hypothetical protein
LELKSRGSHIASPADQAHNCVLIGAHAFVTDWDEIAVCVRPEENVLRVQEVACAGRNIPASTGYFLNTKYIFFRPHANRNFVPIGDERMSTNQDAIVRLIGWAGNMTASGLQFQGVMTE